MILLTVTTMAVVSAFAYMCGDSVRRSLAVGAFAAGWVAFILITMRMMGGS
jgi:hypothetical protein